MGPDDLAPLFPMELILQEVSEAPGSHPGARARDPAALAADAALPRASPRARARDEVAHLLQVRGRQPRGSRKPNTAVAQAYTRSGRPGAPRHGDRGGPVGKRPRARLPAPGPRVQGLHGQGLVPPEAVPALDDGDLGRKRRCEPVQGNQDRPRDPRGRPGFAGKPRHRHLGGRRGRRGARRHRLRARKRPQPRPPPPDRHWPGGARAVEPRARFRMS